MKIQLSCGAGFFCAGVHRRIMQVTEMVMEQFGLPQHWNPNGDNGPERYIEAQIWNECVIREFWQSPS
ncbi:hypothetical protein ACFFSY_06805 [Paenibacillus aurantiacus]|uniref:Uncharacterized protein n=1 Tax=Paenibacillus aurantiacus TaxID=1936118 RepID=A0ABV5KM15_9BACL